METGEAERALGVVESAAAAAAAAARQALGPYASEEACLVEALRRFGDDAEAAVAATAVVAAEATAASFPARVLAATAGDKEAAARSLERDRLKEILHRDGGGVSFGTAVYSHNNTRFRST